LKQQEEQTGEHRDKTQWHSEVGAQYTDFIQYINFHKIPALELLWLFFVWQPSWQIENNVVYMQRVQYIRKHCA